VCEFASHACATRRGGIRPPTPDTSDTLDGRSGNSLYTALIEDFPEEVSNPSKVSRVGGWGRGTVGVMTRPRGGLPGCRYWAIRNPGTVTLARDFK
jgi:hypothetical protein